MHFTPLPKEDRALVEHFRTTMHRIRRQNGIDVNYFPGVGGWLDTLAHHYQGEAIIPDPFNPDRGHVSDENSGWMCFNRNRLPIAWAVMRCDWTDNFARYLQDGLLWRKTGLPLTMPMPDLLSLDELSKHSGTIISAGGGYVAPAFRRKPFGRHRLIGHVSRLVRLYGFLRSTAIGYRVRSSTKS